MSEEKRNWLDRTPIPALPWLTTDVLIFAVIILVAIVTRFYNLGARVMSHDESLHTYYSWLFSRGQGYQHNPMMHGPLQFHLIALTYFIFGASDFTARVPAATFSVLTILMIWFWRRYLGRTGALVAASMALISPFLLYYGRYTREDPYVGVSLFIMLYAVLRYFETGKAKYIYTFSAALVLHYLTKETSFIYSAELLIYLAIYLFMRIAQKPWRNNPGDQRPFFISFGLGIVALAGALIAAVLGRSAGALDAAQTLVPSVPGQGTSPLAPPATGSPFAIIFGLMGILLFGAAIYFLIRGYGWERIRQERSFDLLIVTGTLTLPMLSPFAMKALSPLWQKLFNVGITIPTSVGDLQTVSIPSIISMLVIFGIFVAAAIAIGLFWKKEVWWKTALIFYSVYTVFYTTFFTNGAGFFTGTLGSLGYWLEQQGVQRGSQPWYYYILITIPIYEFLPAIACLLALGFSLSQIKTRPQNAAEAEIEEVPELDNSTNMVTLLGWWTFISIVAFSYAGEKMPWLTFHIALPMVLWGGWAIGSVIDRVNWEGLRQHRLWVVLGVATIFVSSLIGIFVALLSSPLPFQGMELGQLQSTTNFVFALVAALASGFGLFRLLDDWDPKQAIYLATLLFFGVLAVLTMRTSFRANYIDYNSGQEYLVYAHSFTGVKDVLNEVMALSKKTVGTPYDIVVAYDDATSWPMSWYMRDFPNARYYGNVPDMTLRDVPAIIVGSSNYAKVEPIVGDNYYRFDYVRMVWPNQDYFNLVSNRSDPNQPFDENYPCTGVLSVFKLFKSKDYSRLCNAIGNSEMRTAIFNIWLNRDYKKYAELTNSQGLTDSNWDPSDRMRLYIRKDVADMVWSYGVKAADLKPDPYAQGMMTFQADLVFGAAGADPGQFNAPRGLAFAPDGSLYVADSRNNRIEHFDSNGQLLKAWGTFADIAKGAAPLGTFNEPWGVAVGPDGSVYVTDTWNHRVEKFTKDGDPLKAWGVFGLSDTPNALYGPRGITVDSKGRIFVADTGNKRIVIFDAEGAVLGQFGSEGYDPGKFSEPVDVAIDAAGNAYVTDTWNQRIQFLSPLEDGVTYVPVAQWPVKGWKSQSLDNKPFIAVSADGRIFVTDPEGYRVIEFNQKGDFVQLWGTFGTENSNFGLPSGIAVDSTGKIWITDAGNNRVMRFQVPKK